MEVPSKLLKSGEISVPQFRMTFTQKNPFLLTKIAEFYPKTNWHLNKIPNKGNFFLI